MKYKRKVVILIFLITMILIIFIIGVIYFMKDINNANTSGLIPPQRGHGTIVSTDEANNRVVVNSDLYDKLTLIMPDSIGIKYKWDDFTPGSMITFSYFEEDYDLDEHKVIIFSYELKSDEDVANK